MNTEKKVVGYRIETSDARKIIPEEFNSSCIIKESVALRWIEQSGKPEKWKISPIYEGEIAKPYFINAY